ncbi:MAG TPA: DUF1285 domain-containing protein [Candidatus Acidoferrum sp.]|nr:DUF1285 domain-containing protein [Candidatus Acidoferrum sp.]
MSGSQSSVIDPLKGLRAMAAGDRVRSSARQQFCGEIDIRIGRDGTWFYHGSPIGRKPLVKLFASVLRREGDDYWLVTPAERGKIKVDEVPFTAVEVNAVGSGPSQALTFRTNLDDEVVADAQHPIRVAHAADGQEPRPYILVRDRLEARILRPVFYELVELAQMQSIGGEEVYGVWSREQFFPLGRPDPGA